VAGNHDGDDGGVSASANPLALFGRERVDVHGLPTLSGGWKIIRSDPSVSIRTARRPADRPVVKDFNKTLSAVASPQSRQRNHSGKDGKGDDKQVTLAAMLHDRKGSCRIHADPPRPA